MDEWIRMNETINSCNFNSPIYKITSDIFDLSNEVIKIIFESIKSDPHFCIAGNSLNSFIRRLQNNENMLVNRKFEYELFENSVSLELGNDEVIPNFKHVEQCLNDIDIFVINGNYQMINNFRKRFFVGNFLFPRIPSESCRFIQFLFKNIKIQIIKRNYSSVQQVLNSFDVSPCKIAYHAGNFYITEDWLLATRTKSFAMNHKLNGKTYLSRLSKYLLKGYKIYFPYAKNFTGEKIFVKNNELKCVIHKTEVISEYDRVSMHEEIFHSHQNLDSMIQMHEFNEGYIPYYLCLCEKIDKMNFAAGIKDEFSPNFIIHLNYKFGKILSKYSLKKLLIKFNEMIEKRNEEIMGYFEQCIDGRCITEHNDPNMTSEKFLESLTGGNNETCLEIPSIRKYFVFKEISELIPSAKFNKNYLLVPGKIKIHYYIINDVCKFHHKDNNPFYILNGKIKFEKFHDTYFRRSDDYENTETFWVNFRKFAIMILLLYKREGCILNCLPRRLVLNHLLIG